MGWIAFLVPFLIYALINKNDTQNRIEKKHSAPEIFAPCKNCGKMLLGVQGADWICYKCLTGKDQNDFVVPTVKGLGE